MVVRSRPRRYSPVMNTVPTAITTISPAKVPTRKFSTEKPTPMTGPPTTGAMSPAPVTANPPPPVWVKPPLVVFV